MLETWVQSLGGEDPLAKEMATHSGIPAWRIPWTEEPGGLQSMGSQTVGHDLTFTFTTVVQGFPGASVRNPPAMQETCGGGRFDPWLEISWRRKWQPTPVFLPGESHGQRSLVGSTVHGVAKSQTRPSD